MTSNLTQKNLNSFQNSIMLKNKGKAKLIISFISMTNTYKISMYKENDKIITYLE